jgi:hypothetical protein
MARLGRVALIAFDAILVLLLLVYGLLALIVELRPWGGDIRGLFFARHPPDLLVFFGGIGFIVGVVLVFLHRRAAGVVWLCSVGMLVTAALLRQFSPENPYLQQSAPFWFYAAAALAGVVIFVRFLYSPAGLTKRSSEPLAAPRSHFR